MRRYLGSGGFGIVYLGWNTELDIPVAIKEYLPSDCAVREASLSVVPRSAEEAAVYEWGLDRFLAVVDHLLAQGFGTKAMPIALIEFLRHQRGPEVVIPGTDQTQNLLAKRRDNRIAGMLPLMMSG